jgi:hypothetical protein
MHPVKIFIRDARRMLDNFEQSFEMISSGLFMTGNGAGPDDEEKRQEIRAYLATLNGAQSSKVVGRNKGFKYNGTHWTQQPENRWRVRHQAKNLAAWKKNASGGGKRKQLSAAERKRLGLGTSGPLPGFRNGVHWTQTPKGRAHMRKMAQKKNKLFPRRALNHGKRRGDAPKGETYAQKKARLAAGIKLRHYAPGTHWTQRPENRSKLTALHKAAIAGKRPSATVKETHA